MPKLSPAPKLLPPAVLVKVRPVVPVAPDVVFVRVPDDDSV